jgi:sugar phosphate isomerase/epimerase
VLPISFMTANFVARELGWRLPDWGAGDRATNDAFRPIQTYRERLAAVLDAALELGFRSVDLWDAHLSARWATDEHLGVAAELLRERQLAVASLAGWFGEDLDTFAAHCRIANAVGAGVLGGRTALLHSDRAGMLSLLEEHDLRFGLENHPERTPGEVVERIGTADHDGRIGATVDSGWFATQGYDAARAITELGTRVVHVHLKDVAHAGEPHRTAAYGAGVVPLRACVESLRAIGYSGGISIEHEPDEGDPSDDIRRAREQLEAWLAA